MSFQDCINRSFQKGVLTDKQAREINEMYESLRVKYSKALGDEAGAHRAADEFVRVQSAILQKKRENEMRHVLALRRFKNEIQSDAQRIQAEADGAFKGMKWLHGNSYLRAVRDRLESVYERQMSLAREAHMMLAETIEEFRSKNGGFKQDVDGMKDVVREAMGSKTGNDAAAAHGAAVRLTLDYVRDQYEAAGGVMGKIDNYFPVAHEAEAVGKVPYKEWRDYIMPRLDRERMVDLDTALPIDDARMEVILREAYDNIRTNGLVDVAKRADEGLQTFGRGGEINMRRSKSRFFHFKDADAFLEYNEKFGRGDAALVDIMIDHINSLTRDTAIMQHMGAKPTAVMNNVVLEIEARGNGVQAVRTVRGMYDVLSGKNNYGGELPISYKFIMGWLNVKRAAYLGSAPISAISDSYFVSVASKMNGLPSAQVMKRYAKLLDPTDATDRKVARHLFYIASAANGMSMQGARFADDLGRGGKTAFLSSAVNRVSGLAAMTDAGRQAPMMVMAATFADYAKRGVPWGELEPKMQKAAGRFGIGADDWDIIMKARPSTYIDMDDVEWLMPENVRDVGGDAAVQAARKYGDWMVYLGNTAVNEPKLMTKTITSGAILGDAPQGSFLRLMFANVFFAKSFPITVMINNMLPALRDASQGRVGSLASMVAFTTVMGGMAIQLREIIKGSEPKDMDSPSFWLAGTLQGGGLGLFGDFFLADRNRFGNSFAATIPGPVISTLGQILKAGDLYGLADGDITSEKVLTDLLRVGSREIPGVNLWYSRLVFERAILNQIERQIDPRFDSRMRRLERKRERETGSGFWWNPGEITPEALQ